MSKYIKKQLLRLVYLIVLIVASEMLLAQPEIVDISDLSLEELMMQELMVISAAKKPQKLGNAASASMS